MKRVWQILAAAGFLAATMARGQSSDPIGLNALRALDPTLNGAGVIVAQAEAIASGTDGFEVNPAAVGTSGTNLVYISARGTSTSFPNDVGTESGHADAVGDLFYGRTNTSTPEGVAYGVKEIDNYNANDFYSSIVRPGTTAISARIVNQSFVFTTGTDTPAQAGVEQDYDNYAARFNTLFISGINNGNGEPVLAPGTAYNGIGVGAYGGSSSTGPNYDGRSKPDITAPGRDQFFHAAGLRRSRRSPPGRHARRWRRHGQRRHGRAHAQGPASEWRGETGRLDAHGHRAAGYPLRGGRPERV